jgi:hypothetical protein
MINDVMFYIKQNPMLHQYFIYHSYWYKMLLRNPNLLKNMINEMKEEYKLTMKDKIESFGQRMDMISSLLEVLC